MTVQPDIRIRRAALGDLDCVVAFNAAMALETEGKSLDRTTLLEGVRVALTDSRRCHYYMAECDEKVVGQTMITFEWSDWRNGDFWWIQSVYVAPEYRRHGVFRALYEFIRTEAKRNDRICGIRLYAHDDNHGALETYQRLGMVHTRYVVCEEDWS